MGRGRGGPSAGSPARAAWIARRDRARLAGERRIGAVAEGHEQGRVAERLDARRAARLARYPSRSAAIPIPALSSAARTARAISTASGLSPWTQIVSARTATAIRRPR